MKHPCLNAPAESSPETSPEQKRPAKPLPGEKWMKTFSPENNDKFYLSLVKSRNIFKKNLLSPDAFLKDWGFPGENYPPKYLPQILLDYQNFPR